LHLRDRAINDNPAGGLENAPVQATQPDPFERDEVERILADLGKRDGAQVANYFAAAFCRLSPERADCAQVVGR
jgi:hypothetical protein